MIRSTRHLLAYEMGLRSAYRTAGVPWEFARSGMPAKSYVGIL